MEFIENHGERRVANSLFYSKTYADMLRPVLREGSYLDFGGKKHNNASMRNHGIVHNGTIVIDGGIPLPEGTRVVVSIEAESAEPEPSEYRVQFPLVYSATPGKLHLTNEEIAEYLDDDEISR